MLSAPRHPFLAQLLRNAAEAVESGVLNSTRISETVYAIAGPPALRRAMSELLCSPTHQDLGASMQWWNEVGGGLAHVIVRKIEGIRQEWEGRGFKVRYEPAAGQRSRGSTGCPSARANRPGDRCGSALIRQSVSSGTWWHLWAAVDVDVRLFIALSTDRALFIFKRDLAQLVQPATRCAPAAVHCALARPGRRRTRRVGLPPVDHFTRSLRRRAPSGRPDARCRNRPPLRRSRQPESALRRRRRPDARCRSPAWSTRGARAWAMQPAGAASLRRRTR